MKVDFSISESVWFLTRKTLSRKQSISAKDVVQNIIYGFNKDIFKTFLNFVF